MSVARVEGASEHDLVARGLTHATLESAFAEAASGHGRLVLVTAETGGGKTALLERFCAAH